MVELSDREKKLVMIKFIVHGNSQFSVLPVEKRVQMLEAAIKVMGLNWDESEMKELGDAAVEVQQNFIDSGLGWLDANKGQISAGLKLMGTGMDRFKIG